MNITRIEYFLMTAKYMNFTKAANLLYISQPSLSKQIAILEEELGQQLFDRTKRNLTLTPAGKVLYSGFDRLMPEFKSLVEKVKQIKNDDYAMLYIGCVESIYLSNAVIKALGEFSAKNNRVDLIFERSDFDGIRKKTMDGTIDVAFTISHQIENMKEVDSVEIEKRKRYIILSANHRLAGRAEISFEDLIDETFILMDKDKSLVSYDDILGKCREIGYFPKIRYAPNNETILDYLELGVGVAFLDKSIIENRSKRLKYFPINLGCAFSLICIWRKNNDNPILRELVKYLPKSN
jgi:DNA-binding transcriptional LysR family regulator